jgi:hypothetical protein
MQWASIATRRSRVVYTVCQTQRQSKSNTHAHLHCCGRDYTLVPPDANGLKIVNFAQKSFRVVENRGEIL